MSAAWPSRSVSQVPSAPSGGTVLFVCEHGTVKSLLARVLFDEYAQEVGLGMRAVSRGTHPDTAVPPWMMKQLAFDHVTWIVASSAARSAGPSRRIVRRIVRCSLGRDSDDPVRLAGERPLDDVAE